MKRNFFIVALATLALLVPVAVEAQVVQFYLLPIDIWIDPENGDAYRGPSYLKWLGNPEGLDVRWSCKDYGLINEMVCAVNGEQADHDYLGAQGDVYQFPANLDVAMSQEERSAIAAYLEGAYIPADWLSPADTFRTALRTVTGMFLFMQRLTAITGDTPLDWGVGLNDQFRTLDQVHQDAIVQTFTDLGYDDSVIRDNWTLRIILKNAADQWGETPVLFGFVTL